MKTETTQSRMTSLATFPGAAQLPGYHPIVQALARNETPYARLIRLALNEAEALAWQSGVPGLVFVSLAEEKVRKVEHWAQRQQLLLQTTAAMN